MYVDLLSAAMAGEEDEVTTPESLLSDAIACRARMLNVRGSNGLSAHGKLAQEVEYDRALINLCAASGVETDPVRFADPQGERARLELELATIGHELAGTGDRLGRHPD
jgi:hypothetical protein